MERALRSTMICHAPARFCPDGVQGGMNEDASHDGRLVRLLLLLLPAMIFRHYSHVVALVFALTVGGLGSAPTQAANFSHQEVDPTRFAAIAAPIGPGTNHKLLILEQLTQRPCWREVGAAPTVIQLAMMDYSDFTGICSRSVDSNGFSVRMGSQDLALHYSLRIEHRPNDLVLVAYPTRDRQAPTLEIGRTYGNTKSFAKIQLAPGWRLTRRTYNGQPLGHLYLTHDQPLRAGGTPQPANSLAPLPLPSVQAPLLIRPDAGNVVVQPISYRPQSRVGTIVVPVIEPTAPASPIPPGLSPSPTPLPSMPWSNSAQYRVVVPVQPSQVERVKQLVPDAFRTLLNGQVVMQVGLFFDRATAIQRQQQLLAYNLPAQILESSGTVPLASETPNWPTTSTVPSTRLVGFNLAEPDRTRLGSPLRLWSTYYYRHQAPAIPDGNPLLDLQGNSLGVALSDRDWCHAALQGSVQVTAGSRIIGTFNYAGRGEQPQVDCSVYYPKLKQVADTSRVRFKVSKAAYGNGVGGHQLVPFRSIAVDPSHIAIGSLLYVPQARGSTITLPSGQQLVHDGYFYAVDVGNAIRGNHIDTFIGASQTNPFSYVTSTANGIFSAYVVNDPNLIAAMRALHQSPQLTAQTPSSSVINQK